MPTTIRRVNLPVSKGFRASSWWSTFPTRFLASASRAASAEEVDEGIARGLRCLKHVTAQILKRGDALSQDLLLGDQELAQHLREEDVVDLDVVRRQPVVEEGRREHHVVAVEPELDAVLPVEGVHVSRPLEAAPGEDVQRDEEVDQQTGVVERAVHTTEEARATDRDGYHRRERQEQLHSSK